MFSRVTIGFGAALVAASALVAAIGATTTSTAVIPVILGGLLILLGWFGRRAAPEQSPRQRSPSLFATIVAAGLVFSSARGITLVFDALRTGVAPSATGVFLFVLLVAGLGYIAFGALSDLSEGRRIARARAARSRVASGPSRRSGR